MLILHKLHGVDPGSSIRHQEPARMLNSAGHLHANHPQWGWGTPPDAAADETLFFARASLDLRRLNDPRDFDEHAL